MLFNSFFFIITYPLIFLFYYLIPARYNILRNIYLLLTSYLLYIKWKPVYALILLFITIITYIAALYIEKIKKREKRKFILCTSLLLSLLPLLFFKYFNFINYNLIIALSYIGIDSNIKGLNLAIPIGISFFTFQAIGYLCDVYNKRQKAEHDIITYMLFLSFFPCILSGPINKASLVIPQINNLRPYFDQKKFVEGLKMLLWGMFMKVVIADRLALYVDIVFPNYLNHSGLTCLAASILFSIQIYTDFAGYSLMALGVGKTLGFNLTNNFKRPYFAVSISDFWHRWHISLSTWLKDYIYIPLGGNRCSSIRNYYNILMTFIVSGIWHGANWTFIVWGGIHGLCQVIEKIVGQQKCNYGWFGKTIKIAITFLIVNFAWIFFRMPTLNDACNFIKRIFDTSLPMTILIPPLPDPPFILMGLLLLIMKEVRDEFLCDHFLLMNNNSIIIRWITYIALIVVILSAGVFSSDQFIYSNF